MNVQVQEYTTQDSSDYVIDVSTLKTVHTLSYGQTTGYIQNTSIFNNNIWLTTGLRVYYSERNNETLWSPRIQIASEPRWTKKDVVIRAAFGYYAQPAFYREMRNFDGTLSTDIAAQKSIHSILGIDRNMLIRNRGFKLTTEVYYKYYPNIIPYDVDNVRLRYYPDLTATGYATGVDVRLSGEFIPGTVSWFS